MRLADFIPAEGVLFRLESTDTASVIKELAAPLANLNGLTPARVQTLLLERESLGSTALGDGIAVPHARGDVARIVGVLGLSDRGIEFEAPDKRPVRIFVAFVSPKLGGGHLQALAAVGQTMANSGLRSRLLEAQNAAEVHALLSADPKPADPKQAK